MWLNNPDFMLSNSQPINKSEIIEIDMNKG
jgi:hypothetical protein